VRCGNVSRKQSGLCLFVECRGGVVEGQELDPNPMPLFFVFSLFCFFHVLCFVHHLGTKTMCSASNGKEKPR